LKYARSAVTTVTVEVGAVASAVLVIGSRTCLRGVVEGAKGAALFSWITASGWVRTEEVQIGDDGSFLESEDVAAPRIHARVAIGGRASPWQDIPIVEGETAEATFSLTEALQGLAGTVVDEETGAPIADAQIREVSSPDAHTESNDRGEFILFAAGSPGEIAVSSQPAYQSRIVKTSDTDLARGIRIALTPLVCVELDFVQVDRSLLGRDEGAAIGLVVCTDETGRRVAIPAIYAPTAGSLSYYLDPGRYTFSTEDYNGLHDGQTVTVRRGESPKLTFRRR
jgi:hypothetical protein